MKNLMNQLNEQKLKVDFDSYDFSVKEIINMVSEDIINIAPEYQRQFRWDEKRQSVLVESIFLGIPIPNLFMATNADGTWEVIDGVQRISTIVHFAGDEKALAKVGLNAPLTITGLEKLSTLNGLTFHELPNSIKLNFILKPLKITTLSDKSDLNVRFDLFERLNTGGIRLSDQEIRSCIFRGPFNDFLKEMAQKEEFNKVVKLPKEKENDGTPEELVLRFFAYLHNYQNFEHSVVGFLNDFMKNASIKFDYEYNRNLFMAVFSELAVALPNGITRRLKTTPFNLFEAVSVGAALAYKKNGKIVTDGIEEWIQSSELKTLTSGATNSNPKVRRRIEYCLSKFEGK
ncbi:DUF262 domain-containing protein [Effusibacillus dendaii]|uniref:GmrSD restriction endonucleases N-terminal domain-containing protein n=1 Tax=Effusibacillus dendaii TaxID=2743772 RepID=A0A7I8DC67_9BACL|nr:DUF262 domain-containing protein [Effusibacillus dendaii]BCJ87685.1 hypothetical protein skT53_26700 [Effusibacillus dendaii]